MTTWGARLGRVVIALVVGGGLAASAPGAAVAQDVDASERRALERKVEELEAKFRQARDDALADCRGLWMQCSMERCRRIPAADTLRFQACHDACDDGYERCKGEATAIWPEDDEAP